MKWLLKTFAVRFFRMLAEVERCPFVNTSRARRQRRYIITHNELLEVFPFCFSHGIFNFIFVCVQGNIFLSLVCLSLPSFPWCLCQAMVVTSDALPSCAVKVRVHWQQWDRHCTISLRLCWDQYSSGFKRPKWYIWMGFRRTFWKLNRARTGDGKMVTSA